jgi:hypothetical protein
MGSFSLCLDGDPAPPTFTPLPQMSHSLPGPNYKLSVHSFSHQEPLTMRPVTDRGRAEKLNTSTYFSFICSKRPMSLSSCEPTQFFKPHTDPVRGQHDLASHVVCLLFVLF